MPELVINAANNPTYGSPEVNNKYAPLQDIKLTLPFRPNPNEPENPGDRDLARKIISKRLSALSDLGAFPKKLKLYYTLPAPVNVNTPAVIVISSNRAEWIADQFEAPDPKYNPTGYLDGQTITKGHYLWWSPARSTRPVFITVHYTEYDYYVEKLGQVPNVTIVGWHAETVKNTVDVVGFGASRFAALELAKYLGFHRAWVVDDNVVNINGFPNQLTAVEANMTDDMWGIGFKASTIAYAQGNIPAVTSFAAVAYDFSKAAPGLLQQAALWNIDQLRNNNVNMSPCFPMSNEDVSFCNWMIKSKKVQRYIKGLEIVKMAAAPDQKNEGAKEVDKRRTRMVALFSTYESELSVKPPNAAASPLPDFVRNVVIKVGTAKSEKSTIAQCRCAEQVMSAALEEWAPPDGLFNPYRNIANVNDRVERFAPAQLPGRG
jgi:hypothetical protein